MSKIPKQNFGERVATAFLVVPWLPLLIFVPYAPASGKFRLFGWDKLGIHLGFCLVVALFTYLLEVIILIPSWRSMQKSGKTSLLRIMTIAFVVALACVLIVLSIFSGTAFLLEKDLQGLIPLFCFIACAEALVFWLIVRPDKYEQLNGGPTAAVAEK